MDKWLLEIKSNGDSQLEAKDLKHFSTTSFVKFSETFLRLAVVIEHNTYDYHKKYIGIIRICIQSGSDWNFYSLNQFCCA